MDTSSGPGPPALAKTPVESRRVEARGLNFQVLTCGSGDRLALMLHGFPDDPGSLVPLMQGLANAGWFCAAPYLRGYGGSDCSPDGNYQMSVLAGDALALIGALGFDDAMLVGHDWGALIGYVAANAAPDKLTHLVTMAVPPVPTLAQNFEWSQLARSWYIAFFQNPFLPELAIRHGLIRKLWRDWSPGWEPPPGRIDEVCESLSRPGASRAALSYYRSLLVRIPIEFRSHLETRRLSFAPIGVPGLVMAGENDGCMGARLFEGATEAFRGRADLKIVRGAGHFLPLEATEVVLQHILDFVAE